MTIDEATSAIMNLIANHHVVLPIDGDVRRIVAQVAAERTTTGGPMPPGEAVRNILDGKAVFVPSSDGTAAYAISRSGDVVSCSCPSWQHGKGDPSKRRCKHIDRLLGQAKEGSR